MTERKLLEIKMGDKNYYINRKEELLKEYDEEARVWGPFVHGACGEIGGWRILVDARKAFEDLVPQIPYIGGNENRRTENFVQSVRYLAFYLAMKKHGKTAEEAGKILYDALASKAGKTKKIPSGWKDRGKYYGVRKRGAEESQERRYPGDYVYKFVSGDGKKFDYGYDYSECASVKFFHKLGADEFMPFYCYLDYPICGAMGLGLTRTKTLAEGHGMCNHRFSPGKETKLVWPPPFLKKKKLNSFPDPLLTKERG